MKHKETGYVFAVKMINDELMESNDKRNSEIMDLEAPLKFGDGCPYLIKFYGALHAEVIPFEYADSLNFMKTLCNKNFLFGVHHK